MFFECVTCAYMLEVLGSTVAAANAAREESVVSHHDSGGR